MPNSETQSNDSLGNQSGPSSRPGKTTNSELDLRISSNDINGREARLVTKAEFANFLRTAKGGQQVDSEEVDLFFDILDTDKDGLLSKQNSKSYQEEDNDTKRNNPYKRWLAQEDQKSAK